MRAKFPRGVPSAHVYGGTGVAPVARRLSDQGYGELRVATLKQVKQDAALLSDHESAIVQCLGDTMPEVRLAAVQAILTDKARRHVPG